MIVTTDAIDQVIESLKSIKDLKKQMLKQEESLLQVLYNHMKENDQLISEDGEIILTWKYTEEIEFFDNRKLKSEDEELYNKYKAMRPGHRRLMIK